MFFLLRAGLIIGLIFYFSPVRQESGTAANPEAAGWARDSSRVALDAVGQAEQLQSLWKALPDEAKKAAVDKFLASAPEHPSVEPDQATDTLLPGDLKPAWRGGRAPGASRQP